MKKPHAQELSRNKPILRFDVILQHNWPIEQCLLHIKVFFGREKKRPWSDLFIRWLIKQITNTYQNHFSRSYEIRSKGYMGMKKFSQACFSLFPRFMHSTLNKGDCHTHSCWWNLHINSPKLWWLRICSTCYIAVQSMYLFKSLIVRGNIIRSNVKWLPRVLPGNSISNLQVVVWRVITEIK